MARIREFTQDTRRNTSKAVSQTDMGYHAMSDRILLVKIHGKPFNLSIIQVYAPTSASPEEEI